jgi:hypothetical protein
MEEKEIVKKTTADYVESIFINLILGAIIITALILVFNSCQQKKENELIKDALIEVLKEQIVVSPVK